MEETYRIIETLCAERGISVTELCRRTGASRAALSDYKNGRTKRLSTDTLSRIAAYFGVSVDRLLGGAAAPQDRSARSGGEPDELIAFYGEVRGDLEKADIEDIKKFMEIKAQLRRAEKQ
jgi:transcriptional regulator with XRE-family HTH domain